MKNLITSFSILNFKKNMIKNLKENSSSNKENLVHYRRDLDSLGWFKILNKSWLADSIFTKANPYKP